MLCAMNLVLSSLFIDSTTTKTSTLSLHDALPISLPCCFRSPRRTLRLRLRPAQRSEEHTSELQSLRHLVCRLLLERKKGDYLSVCMYLALLLMVAVGC